SRVAANWLFNVAPKDGSVIALADHGDDAAVLWGDVVKPVGGDATTCARHVLRHQRRIARDMLADVTPHRPGEKIDAAPGGLTDDDPHLPSLVEVGAVIGRGRCS